MSKFWIGTLLGVICIVGVLFAANAGWFSSESPHQVELNSDRETSREEVDRETIAHNDHQPLGEALGVSEDQMVDVGGIKRPIRDLDFENNIRRGEVAPKIPFRNPGKSKPLKGDESEQIQQLAKELREANGTQQATSTFKRANDFDLANYREDPGSYLIKVRPGRVFESAQPGPDVMPIKSESPRFQRLLQGESAVLQVKVDPGMPVTFYTPTVATFQNQLTMISVAADDQGIARATLLAGPGTMGMTEVLASSPVHSGQINFRVDVKLPDAQAGGRNP